MNNWEVLALFAVSVAGAGAIRVVLDWIGRKLWAR